MARAPRALPSHSSQQLWGQPVDNPVCSAVDSSWVELYAEISQQRPFRDHRQLSVDTVQVPCLPWGSFQDTALAFMSVLWGVEAAHYRAIQ